MEVVVGLFDSSGDAILGGDSNTSIKIRRSADGFLLDWNSMTFKNNGWAQLTSQLVEINDVDLEGYYKKEFPLTNFRNGWYHFIFNYINGPLKLSGSQPFLVNNELELENSNINDLNTIKGLVHHNVFIDSTIYDNDGNLVSGRVRIYSDSASVGTNNNVLNTYLLHADCNEAGKFISWSQVQI